MANKTNLIVQYNPVAPPSLAIMIQIVLKRMQEAKSPSMGDSDVTIRDRDLLKT